MNKRKWVFFTSIAALLVILTVAADALQDVYASNHPTDTYLTFQTVSTNQMKSSLKYKNSDTFTIESWFKVSSFPPQFYNIAGSATGNNVSAGLIVRSTKKIVFRDFATETTDRDILSSTTTLVPLS